MRHHAIGSGRGSGAGGVRCHSTEGVAEERQGGRSGSGSGSGRQAGAGSIRGSPYSMEQIIRECGLWPTHNLLAQCKDFKCKEGATTCCCRRILFTQPDFVNQKSELEEYIVSRGHICDFYPKFHCELNFIEQYWGAAKYCYRVTPKAANMDEMKANVLACLDDVPLLQIQRLAHFKFVYYKL